MRENPELTVVMSVYNESWKLVQRAVESILQQSFQDFEFIIVLDNPHNKEAETYLESVSCADKRVRLIKNKENMGVAFSLNRAIQLSNGRFIAIQDADDVSHLDRFEHQIKFFKDNPEYDVVGTALNYYDENGLLLLKREYTGDFSKIIKRRSPIAHATTMIKKRSFDKGGYYEEDNYVVDYELWIRWYLAGLKFFSLQKVLYDYFQRPGNIKKRARSQLKATIKVKWKYRKRLHLSILDYGYLFLECILLLIPQSLLFPLFIKAHKARAKVIKPRM